MDQLVFREVDATRWSDLARLFNAPGGPSYCWCTVWRELPSAARSSAKAKREAMQQRVQDGVPVGILGYRDGEPVAWCSIAPKETYRSALGGPQEDGDSVWSLVCFFLHRRLRGEGVGRQLLAAAVDHARSKGATVLEAYPVDRQSPSYRFMGFVPMFQAAGFREVGLAGSRRHVMRLAL